MKMRSAIVIVLTVTSSVALGTAHHPQVRASGNSNLANPSFEEGAAAQDTTTTFAPTGWAGTGSATQAEYGANVAFPAGPPVPQVGERQFLAGGPGSAVSSVSQEFLLTAWISAGAIDTGQLLYSYLGFLGGFEDEEDYCVGEIQLADSVGTVLLSSAMETVTAADRDSATVLLLRGTSGPIPRGTRKVTCSVTMTRVAGTYNNAYCDGMYFQVIIPDAVAATTWSKAKGLYR